MLCSDPNLFPTSTGLTEGQPVYGHLIANKWVQGERPPLPVSAPATGKRFAWIEAHDTGKPISQARADMRAVARYFEFYGDAADKVHGEVIPCLNGYNVTVVREPFGVTAHITPWNYPAQMFGRTIAPALAMGNATVLKPAEEACLVCLELGDRKSTRLNSSHLRLSRMPSSA